MKRLLTRPWTKADEERLIRLCDDGASLMRAAAALGRATSSVQKKARALGKHFKGVRLVRADLRASGALPDSHE